MQRLVAELHEQFAESAKLEQAHLGQPERSWAMAGEGWPRRKWTI